MSLSRTLFRTLPLTASVALAFASGAQAQSLVEMYDAARGYDAGFISAKAQFEANLARANQALGGILPNISVSVSQVRTDFQRQAEGAAKSAITELETKTTAATLVQPIYRPAAWATYRQGGRQLQQAAAQYEAAEHDLLVRVSQAYFDVLTSEDNLELVQNQKKAVSEQLASAQRNFEVGTATITGVRDAQARFDLANAQAIAAENELRTKRLALNMVVGLSDAKPKRLAKSTVLVEPPKEDVNAWVSQAQTNSPAVRQAQLAVEVADYEMDKATAVHKPTLDAQMTYGRTENLKGSFVGTTYASTPTTTWNPSVGLVLNVPLFAGFSGVYKVKEAIALKDKAQSDLENARRGTEQATRNTYFGLLAGLSQVKAYEAAEASSQSALDANKLGYSVGVNINIDVLNSQSQLYQTKRDLAKARYDVLVTNLKLRQAAGTLTPADLQPINDLLVP
ncbi:TolC family outer membrane protein [Limnohabitans sp. TEGF004]|jgi:outer membrane protein|uniref:TolC family outer membrane protein n=1 Tax=Limnohabitans sp. TEGF004 TaxID=2986281 RepID=UPI002377BA1E|nr:TolC family outer membrane protein [Limnohabitans sp. TEGF004]BDU54964.1 outer membrane protein [Limnohabitans sp. TEGF004]